MRTGFVTALLVSLATVAPAAASPKHCPPGLAKKAVPCVPPGQVGKSWRDDDRWREGDRLRGEYVLIPRRDWERYRLRAYEDSLYALVDNEILRVARDTLIVLEAVRIIDAALD